MNTGYQNTTKLISNINLGHCFSYNVKNLSAETRSEKLNDWDILTDVGYTSSSVKRVLALLATDLVCVYTRPRNNFRTFEWVNVCAT